jgi:hypothetical protein
MNIEERRAELNQQRAFEKKWNDLLFPLSKKELIALNEMIVHRVRIMNRLDTLGSMSLLKIGDKVKWNGSDGNARTGTIVRLNSKTASVAVENEGQWRISPQLLEKIS